MGKDKERASYLCESETYGVLGTPLSMNAIRTAYAEASFIPELKR